MTHKQKNFADIFPAATEAGWKKSVDAVLKGASFQTLVSASADSIAIQPLYAAAQGPRALRQKSGDWDVVTRIDLPDFDAANAQALADLEGGATGLHLVFAESPAAYGFGISRPSSAKIRTLLANVQLQTGVRIELDTGIKGADVALVLADFIKAEGIAPNLIKVGFGLDPVSGFAVNGPVETSSASFAASAKMLAGYGFGGSVVAADGSVVHAAGGSEAQELAFVLASALESMRELEKSGMSLDQARGILGFRLAADADEFLTLGKFRALRLLWARVEAACGLEPKPIDIFGKSAWSMMSKLDPWVNVLRTGTAAFSAGIGGADAISLLPFSQAIGLPDAFARRMARNTQLILLQESHLGHVSDAAAGAGGFEALTHELCEKAWTLFQQMAAQGGVLDALKNGAFQAEVAEVRAAKQAALKDGKAKLIGVTVFQNKAEVAVEVLAPIPPAPPTSPSAFSPLTPIRIAESFES